MKIKSRISKRIFALLLVVAMIMSLMPSVAATNSGSIENENSLETQSNLPFTDVSNSKWYYDDVVYVYENGIMIGVGNNKFEPEGTVTRAQFVKAIANMAEKLDYDTSGYLASDVFSDVKAGMYYDEAMGWAKQNDILQGTGSTTAEPEAAVTREQMAAFLYRYVEFLGYELDDSHAEINYSDKNSVSTWAASAVTALTKAGVFNGISEQGSILFKPQEASTRAQMAALLHRLLEGGMYEPTSPSPSDPSPSDPGNVLNVPDGQNYEVSGTETYDKVVLGANSTLSAADNGLLTLTVDGIETVIESGKTYSGEVVLKVTEKLAGDQGSLTTVNTSNYWPYRTGLYFEDNTGYIQGKSVPSAVMNLENVGTNSASGISITGTTPQFSAMIFNGPLNYTVSDSVIDLTTTADGSQDQVNDFSALGAAIGVYNGATVTLDNVDIHTTGVAKPSVVTDSANMLMKNSTFLVEGGTLYDGYQNTADMAKMVAPPWVLGIGGNARGTNLLGQKSVNVFLDSDLTANGWGVLSSDSGQNGVISVINSDVKLPGNTGYGIYVIGGVNETYYGTNFDVATYSVIMTGGTSKFTSYTGGQSIDVANYDGNVVFPGLVSEKVETGTVVNSKVNSQFGVMSHNTGTVILEEGTVFNTKNAAFLIKDGTTTLNVKDSEINVEDGILIQLIDNDDSAVGADMSSGAPVFNTGYNEKEGWPTVSTKTDFRGGINATFTNVQLKGDMYNASGYQYSEYQSTEVKEFQPKTMDITLGAGATLEGVISKARSMHVWMEWIEDENDTQGGYYDYMLDEDGNYIQATEFTINEYYNLGHVVNQAYADAKGTANVVLQDGAVWTVTGMCYLTTLTIDANSDIILPEGYEIIVNGTIKAVDELKGAGTVVGTIEIREPNVLVVEDGQDYTVSGTETYDAVILGENATLSAADSGLLTMTVDGVETEILSGMTYSGDIVLTVTEAFTDALYGTGTPPDYRTALYVNNGSIDYSRSVVSALSGGTYSDTAADGVSITSRNNEFAGFIINNSAYTISNTKIDFTGDAGNDFAGFGAGLAVTGGSDVTVNDSEIYVKGQARSTIFVGSDDPENPAKLTVNDSEVIGADSDTAGNTCVWLFGATGNNRATNVVGYARIAYNNCILKSQGWGILATDDVQFPTTQEQVDNKDYTVMLDIKDSAIEATDPDQNIYGSYSIGACYNSFTNTTFNVTGFAMVVANEYAGGAFLDGTEVNSDRFGIQWHFNQGGETTIEDSTFNTGLTTFLIKECSPIITVRNAELNAGNGVIMQIMDSDDPGMGGATAGTYDDTIAAKDGTHDVYSVNSADTTLFGSFGGGGGFDYTYVTDAQASFADMSLEGDFYNAANNTPMNMVLSLDNVDYTGVISSSTAVHPDNEFDKDKAFNEPGSRATLGVVENTASATVNNGALVTLTGGSTWTVTGTCYLTGLTIESSSAIAAPDGYKVAMKIGGTDTPIEEGTYEGAIVISLVELLP